MKDKQIVKEYRNTVHLIHCLQQQIAWNIRHQLPVLTMPDQVHELIGELLRFEDILDGIPDRRTRNIICCRYALGMNEHDTAFMIGISAGTVNRIVTATLQKMQD